MREIVDKICSNTYLVGLTSEKYGTIADAEGALLFLAFLVDLRDCPGFDGVCLGFGGSSAYTFCRVDVNGRCRAGRRVRNDDARNCGRGGSGWSSSSINGLRSEHQSSAQGWRREGTIEITST
jgi:hypothetical protein